MSWLFLLCDLSNFCYFWYDFVDQDACFTSDSDAFLFGARTVYREICLGKSYLFLLPVHGDEKRNSIPVCFSDTKSITYVHLRWRWLCCLLWDGWYWEKTGIWKEFLGIFFPLSLVWFVFRTIWYISCKGLSVWWENLFWQKCSPVGRAALVFCKKTRLIIEPVDNMSNGSLVRCD